MREPIDWNKSLQITINNRTFKVYNLGFGWKNKRLVQIEEGSVRFPFHDGTLPNVFCPDESGYVVQFDTYIENVPEGVPLGFSFKLSKLEEWNDCCNALREQGFLIIKG